MRVCVFEWMSMSMSRRKACVLVLYPHWNALAFDFSFFCFFFAFWLFFVYYYYLLFIILPSHYTSTPLLPKFNYFRLHVNWNWNWFKFCQHFVRSTFIYVFEVFSQFSLFVFCIFCFFFFYFCVVCCCFLAKNAQSSSCCIQLVLPEFGYTFEMLAMNATNARRPEWIRIIS